MYLFIYFFFSPFLDIRKTKIHVSFYVLQYNSCKFSKS